MFRSSPEGVSLVSNVASRVSRVALATAKPDDAQTDDVVAAVQSAVQDTSSVVQQENVQEVATAAPELEGASAPIEIQKEMPELVRCFSHSVIADLQCVVVLFVSVLYYALIV